MSTKTKKPMRRFRRPNLWDSYDIKQEVVEKVSRKRVSSGPWTQDKTTVTNGDITLEVGSRITGYEAEGISDWYVLGTENGHLLITTKSCPKKVELSGRDGYTNGVEILNNVAMKYTNSIYADRNARSIKVDDINRVTGFNPESAVYGVNKHEHWQYGNKVTYYWDGTEYPYYLETNGVTGKLSWFHGSGFYYPTAEGFNCSQKSTTATKSNKEEMAKLTSTFYNYEGTNYVDEIHHLDGNSIAYQLLFNLSFFGKKDYWLGSPYVMCGTDYSRFGLRRVCDGSVYGTTLVSSAGVEYSGYCGVLPVVSLKSEVTVDSDGNITI